MRRLAACLLTWGLAAAGLGATGPPPDLASELLALSETPARERWLAAHRIDLTAALGREIAARAEGQRHAGRYDDANDAYTLALRIGEILDDPTIRLYGALGLGEVSGDRGEPARALALLEQAMREARSAADAGAIGRILGEMGNARRLLGENAEARDLFERQLALAEESGDRRQTGIALNNLGIVLGAMGRYAEAIPPLERARASFEDDPPATLDVLNNLGACHRALGHTRAALEAYGRCLRIAEATGDAHGLSGPLANLGHLYLMQGLYPMAEDYYRRSYAVAAARGEKTAMATVRAAQGTALLRQGRLPEAQAALEQARALGQELQAPELINAASADLADVYWRLGDHRRARERLDECLSSAERIGQMPLVVHARQAIAVLELEDGRAAAAVELAEQAAASARELELADDLWPALVAAGRAHAALGQGERAESALREAVEVVEEQRRRAVGPEADRTQFLVSRSAPYQELVALLAESGRTWEALEAAESNKGRVLREVLSGGRASLDAKLGDEDRAEQQRLQADLLAASAELRTLRQQPHPDAAQVKRLERERARGRVALEDFRTREDAAHPELRVDRGESPPLTHEDAARLLAGGRTAILEYALTRRHVYLFVLSLGSDGAASVVGHALPADTGELLRLARDLRERLARRDLDVEAVSAQLYAALLGPAADVLRRADRVVIVPDWPLGELPFHALRPSGGRYLIEDAVVSYAPSLAVLRDMRAHRRAATDGAALLAVGNPDLGRPARRRGPALHAFDALPPLPEAETEVRAIARLYDAATSTVRVGTAAREPWLKSEAGRYRILHLATHGVLDDASPLDSQLVLAAPRPGEADDGLLAAREILDLHLDADLAVLSACETARGETAAGEGLVGMTWAFFVAGCPATVASQWKVEAASTGRLMLAFHRALAAGRSPAEALREAAVAQLRRHEQRHPFYWAGFVAIGDADTPVRRPTPSEP
jgi:CHAT domain-containing protein/Tfp pilus assembly protein PilF